MKKGNKSTLKSLMGKYKGKDFKENDDDIDDEDNEYLNMNINDLINKAQGKECEFESLRQEIDNLKDKLEKANKKNEKLKEKSLSVNDELQNLKRRFNKLKEENEFLKNNINTEIKGVFDSIKENKLKSEENFSKIEVYIKEFKEQNKDIYKYINSFNKETVQVSEIIDYNKEIKKTIDNMNDNIVNLMSNEVSELKDSNKNKNIESEVNVDKLEEKMAAGEENMDDIIDDLLSSIE